MVQRLTVCKRKDPVSRCGYSNSLAMETLWENLWWVGPANGIPCAGVLIYVSFVTGSS